MDSQTPLPSQANPRRPWWAWARRPRPATGRNRSRTPLWVYDTLLIAVLLAGAYLRLVGLNWGEYQYLHPDERFLVWVGSDIAPIGTTAAEIGAAPTVANTPWRAAYLEDYADCTEWGGYFDASCSPLIPTIADMRSMCTAPCPSLPPATWLNGFTGIPASTR